MIWLYFISLAVAGYGDPVDGLPSLSERELHMWTNAVRVDPQAFDSEYRRGGCSFSQFEAKEQSVKFPLLWNPELNEAARFHSEDMQANDHFSHTSFDGTPFSERISRFYTEGYVGENIAWGYPDPYIAVMEGWMCSPGHRANIMQGGYNELGTGQDGLYYTQNFGGRQGLAPRAISMGVHLPPNPTTEATFVADFRNEDGFHPEKMDVVVNGESYPMFVKWGEADMGVYTTVVEVDKAPCHAYFFRSIVDGQETRFPEEGMYGWGDCIYNDWDAQWFAQQWLDEPSDKKKLRFGGCTSLTGVPPLVSSLWTFVLVGLCFVRRRD